MKSIVLILAIGFLTLESCNRVPLTNRKQLNLVHEQELLLLSKEAYSEILSESQVVTHTREAETLKAVGMRISTAVEKFLKDNGHSKRLKDFEWQFTLIKNDTMANAWCMPGGKVAFYTGLLPATKDINGMAVVVGHEIAHAVARHGNERMSQGLAAQLGGVALGVAIRDKPEETKNIFYSIYGVGAQVGLLLPYSRTHESEADRLGLVFMAMAGYDPNGAIAFWARMETLKGGYTPEFLSTHPSHDTRIRNIKEVYLPEAMKYYKPVGN